MKVTVKIFVSIAQSVVALLIIIGVLPIIALAWLMLAPGALIILSLLAAVIADAASKEV